MPSTASDLLKLELQATGENTSTWGSKANVLFERAEQAIGGSTSVVLSSSDYTLDDTQYVKGSGTTAEAHRMHLACSGALASNVNVIVPARTKLYLVSNTTTNAFTVTVKTAAGTGVVIPQGYWMFVWCDGTNVTEATLAINASGDITIPGSASITGDLTIQGGDIFDANGNEIFKITSTASAVNEITVANAATTDAPAISATGSDTNIDLVLNGKGTGRVLEGSNPIVNVGTTATFTTGFNSDVHSLGNSGTGTITLAATTGEENLKTLTINGSFTLAPQTTNSVIAVIATNDGTGGYTITTSGYDIVSGSYNSAANIRHLFRSTVIGTNQILEILEIGV